MSWPGKGSGCRKLAGGTWRHWVSALTPSFPVSTWPRNSAGGWRRWPAQPQCRWSAGNKGQVGAAEVPGTRAHPYHGILVVDFNDNDGRIVPQLMSFAIELQIVEHQHLVPGGTQGLIQHLQHGVGRQVTSDRGWADARTGAAPTHSTSTEPGGRSDRFLDSSRNLKIKASVRFAPNPLPTSSLLSLSCEYNHN